MKRFATAIALLVPILLAGPPAVPAAPRTARSMYAAAQASEAALRAAIKGGRPVPTLAKFRSVIAAYEAVSRRFPSTGYADNALWQAAVLSLDAHDRFGDERERRTARRLLQALVDRYPSSSLTKKSRAELDRITAAPATAAPPAVSARPSPPPESRLVAADVASSPEAAAAPAGHRLPAVRQIRRTVTADGVRVTIEVESEVNFRTERVEQPPRVLFDLAGTRPGEDLVQGTLSYPDGIVRYIRVGRHPNDVTRVVLDLTGSGRYSTFTMYDPYRIVIDCETERPAPIPSQRIAEETLAPPVPDPAPPETVGKTEPSTAQPPDAPVAKPPEPPVKSPAVARTSPDKPKAPRPTPLPKPATTRAPLTARRLPQSHDRQLPVAVGWSADELLPPLPAHRPYTSWALLTPAALPNRTLLALAAAAPPTSAPVPEVPAPKPAPVVMPAPPAPLPSGFSLARQLGLGVSRVVIDPGHGGHDPGALGSGITEAAVVLDVALRLEKLLKAAGVEVVLTRRTDEYLPLEERTRLANAAHGDLFLSIHANASRNREAQGIESYVLNFASNPEAEAVAARENAASAGNMSNLAGIVRAITLNNKLDESRGLAGSLQAQLVKKLKGGRQAARDHGVKQAPFVVLIGASMPSVLVEISFITHRQEGRLLKTTAYRQKIAEALFEGIRGYQRSLKRADAVSNR